MGYVLTTALIETILLWEGNIGIENTLLVAVRIVGIGAAFLFGTVVEGNSA